MHAPPRTRRRGSQLEQAILDAAWEELVAVGTAGVTMSAVAARARTSKAVLYRRWPSRGELIAAAVERRVPQLGDEAPDTGTLRDDALAVLTRQARRQRELRLAPDDDTGIALHLRRRICADAEEHMRRVAGRAATRGEVPHEWLTARAVRLPVDLVERELDATGAPATSAAIAAIVDELFLPLVAGVARRRRMAPPG